MKKIFQSDLVKDVITSYIWMIVFPVMIILGIAFVLASQYIYRASTNSVQVAQDTVLSLYTEELRDAAISLSHVANLNNGASIQQAASGTNSQEQKAALSQLDTMYQLLAAPEYRLLDIQIYRRDGLAVTPRWGMKYSIEELREKKWYQEALSQPGQVCAVLENDDYFYRIRAAEKVMVIAAIVPRNMPDIECIVLYKLSDIPEVIKKYNKSKNLGQICIMDMDGKLLTERGKKEAMPSWVLKKIQSTKGDEIQFSKRGIRYIVKTIPGTERYIISAVNESEMFWKFRLCSLTSLIVIFCVIVIFIVYFKRYMSQLLVPLHNLTEGMKEVECHNLHTRVEMCEQKDISKMISVFNSMVSQINQLIMEKEMVEKEKYHEELLALQSQMNPHLLMNTLNTLKFMAISAHFDGMRDIVTALENILAAVLNRNGGFCTVEEEESVLNSYIYIMEFRYMESFEVIININPEVKKCKIPQLILQPIVENSIIHGFDGLGERQGKIEIKGYAKANTLIFEILDNGQGIASERISEILEDTQHNAERHTIGVSNTNRRIKLNFGQQYGVEIESELGEYTKIVLTMPLIGDREDSYV